jgi:hypothetical protein
VSRRGSFALYLVAFGLLLGALAGIGVATARFLESLTPLWVSVVCSVAAIALAIAAVLWPRRP